MARGGRNIPGLKQRFALKGKMLVKLWKGKPVVQAWPKAYGPPRSQAAADVITAFKRGQRAMKFMLPRFTIAAMDLTAKTGMYPRDILYQAMVGTNIQLAIDEPGAHTMIGDGLQKFTALGTEAFIDFQNIPLGYSGLLLQILGRDNVSATNTQWSLTLNGDTGPRYDFNRENRFGSTQGVSVNSIALPSITAATAPANYPGAMQILIPGYASQAFYKSLIARGSIAAVHNATNLFEDRVDGWWQSLAQVSTLRITAATSFHVGTEITLYGLF
jgi:hypothetical protein